MLCKIVTSEFKESEIALAKMTVDITASHGDPFRVLNIESQLSAMMIKELVGFF